MAQIKKFSPMRFTGATETAAVEGALLMAGVSREDADYEVLEQSAKGVTVRIKPRSQDAATAPVSSVEVEPVVEAPLVQESVVSAEMSNVPARFAEFFQESTSELEEAEAELQEASEGYEDDEAEEADVEDVESAEEINAPDEEEEADSEDVEPFVETENDQIETEITASEPIEPVEENEVEATETESAEVEPTETEPVIEVSEETRQHAASCARGFLGKMGLDAQVELQGAGQNNVIALNIEGEDVGILIGKHGQTLQSFQYLLNLTLNNTAGENGEKLDAGVRVTIDAGNYKARRQSSLENTARNAAQRARTSGRPFRLEPMTASERRIVHLFLSRETGISTQSEGREPRRRIVIFPTDVAHSTYNRHEVRQQRGVTGMGAYGANRRGGRR